MNNPETDGPLVPLSEADAQRLIDSYFRHLYYDDPAAQATAAAYLEDIKKYGLEWMLGDTTEETFEDITLAGATLDQLPAGAELGTVAEYKAADWYQFQQPSREGLALGPEDPGWEPPTEEGETFTDGDTPALGESSIGSIIGIGALAIAAAFMFGKK